LNNELNNKNIKISQTEQLVTEIKNYSEENTSLTKRNHQLQKEQELWNQRTEK
jgi:FtsZ-binding cell division protein ZapB